MTTKTYLWTNTYNTPFPPEFVSSKNKRYIIIEQCKAIYNDTLIGDVIMHADFIERDHFCDYSACFVNEEPNKDTAKYDKDTAKYEYVGYKNNFNIWFTDMDLNKVDVDKFMLRLLLIY